MTLSTTSSKTIAQGNGVTTVFNFSFPVLAAADLVVIYTDSTGTESTLDASVYTTTGIGATSTGGTVTYPLAGAIDTGTTLTIMRVVTLSQGTSITGQGSFDAAVLEAADDFQMMAAQQLDEKINRGLIAPPGEPALPNLPSAEDRAGQTLMFDDNGDPLAGAGTTTAVSSVMLPVVQASTLASARQILGSDASNLNPIINPDSAVVQLGTSIANINDNAYASDNMRVLSEANATVSWLQSAAFAASGYLFSDQLSIVINTNKFGVFKPIENKDLDNFAATQTVIAAASIWADASIGNVKMGILAFTGTADAISGDPITTWGADGVTPTLAANWAFCNTPTNLGATAGYNRFSVTGVIPSNMANLALFIWCDDKTTTAVQNLFVGNYDLRMGSTVQPFAPTRISDNLARCQRYLWKTFPQATAPATAATSVGAVTVNLPTGATGTFGASVAFPQVMRTIPTITTYSPISANANWRDTTNNADRTVTVDTTNASDRAVMLTGAAGAAGSTNRIHLQADARL